jgi:hypothetical protein
VAARVRRSSGAWPSQAAAAGLAMNSLTPDVGELFLGHRFMPVNLGDKAVLRDYLLRYPQRVSGYSFATLAAWSQPYGVEWAQVGPECLLLSRTLGEQGERHLLQPIGQPSAGCCMDLLSGAEKLPYRLKMLYVAREYIDRNPEFCARFATEEDRNSANYIYLARDLAELPGGRYAKKRNLISQFLTLYPNWQADALDTQCGPLCREVLLAIAHNEGVAADDSTLQTELQALDFTIAHFEALELSGILIRVDGKPVAFSIYERQNIDTAVVHFEKALRSFKGLYQLVNRETARMIVAAGYHLINREEDLGHPGLRQAKLSYLPLDIYPVFDLTLNGGDGPAL